MLLPAKGFMPINPTSWVRARGTNSSAASSEMKLSGNWIVSKMSEETAFNATLREWLDIPMCLILPVFRASCAPS